MAKRLFGQYIKLNDFMLTNEVARLNPSQSRNFALVFYKGSSSANF